MEIFWKPYHIVGNLLGTTSMALTSKASISIVIWSYSKHEILKNVAKIKEQKMIRKEEEILNKTIKRRAYQLKN